MAKVGPKDVVYDLGCGDGRMVIIAINKFGAKRGVGVDLDPERIKESKENAEKYKVADKVEFRVGDVLKIKDLRDADVVLLYMGDDINLRLRPILKQTLKPGARIVSHRFTMGDWKPQRTITVNEEGEDYHLHLWRIGKRESTEETKKESGR
jgi:ribosomal protein L11 methylase PrmA